MFGNLRPMFQQADITARFVEEGKFRTSKKVEHRAMEGEGPHRRFETDLLHLVGKPTLVHSRAHRCRCAVPGGVGYFRQMYGER